MILTVFSENVLGGIQTFYLNLLSQPNNSYSNVQWLLLNHCDESRAKAPNFSIRHSIVPYCNKYGRWRKANKLIKYIEKGDGLILVNREFELDALSVYPQKNKTVCHIVHDDYYLQFAVKYEKVIDFYIAHNSFIYKELTRLLPHRIGNIHFLPFGIHLSQVTRTANNSRNLKAAFIARLAVDKGIHELVKIDALLQQQQCNIDWLVIGDGPEKNLFLSSIEKRENFKHKICKDDKEIFSLIKECDIFVLPSLRDGTPVALLESMSVGLVPIIYNFNDGIKDVVRPEIGFVGNKGNILEIVNSILELHNNRLLLEEMSVNAKNLASNNFNVVKRASAYYDLFEYYKGYKYDVSFSGEKPIKLLDNVWVPELFATFVKKVQNRLK